MQFVQRYWVLLTLGGLMGFFYFSNQTTTSSNNVTPTTTYNNPQDINLRNVLDVTVDTIYAFEQEYGEQISAVAEKATDTAEIEDQSLWAFVSELKTAYNDAVPAIDSSNIGVQPMANASFIGFTDVNLNDEWEEGSENPLFLIEIDSAQSRVIATSNSGAVNEHRVSGAGFFSGFLMGRLLDRQRASGVTSSKLAAKKPITAQSAARARAGTGSYSRGK